MITTTAPVRNQLALLAEVILALIKPSFSLALLAFCSVVMELMGVAALLLLWSYALLLCFRPAPTQTTAPSPGPTNYSSAYSANNSGHSSTDYSTNTWSDYSTDYITYTTMVVRHSGLGDAGRSPPPHAQ